MGDKSATRWQAENVTALNHWGAEILCHLNYILGFIWLSWVAVSGSKTNCGITEYFTHCYTNKTLLLTVCSKRLRQLTTATEPNEIFGITVELIHENN